MAAQELTGTLQAQSEAASEASRALLWRVVVKLLRGRRESGSGV